MSKVFIEESTLTAIGDAIREKEGSAELIPTAEMPQRIGALSGDGDDNAKYTSTYTVDSLNVFGKKAVTLDLLSVTALSYFCNVSKLENVNTTLEELTINCSKLITNIYGMLSCGNNDAHSDSHLRKVTLNNVDTSTAAQCSMVFTRQKALEEIVGTPLDFSSATALGGAFTQCISLREVRFKGEVKLNFDLKSSPLSKASIVSAISVLSDNTSGTTLSLKKSAVNTAFETSKGAADGSTSAEWLALVEAHSNWTISLT